MLVLKIIGAIVAILAIGCSLMAFNNHCNRKFSYSFFTKISFFVTAASLVLVLAGNSWRESATHSNGDILNGIIIMAIGVLMTLGLIFFNFKKTNLLYGTGGTLLQLSLFGVLSIFGMALLIPAAVLAIFFSPTAKPVYIVNK